MRTIVTLLCAAITATTIDEMIDQSLRAVTDGADLVELRLDYLEDLTADLDRLLRQIRCPVIITCRPGEEGGRYSGDESARIRVLEEMALAGADFVDCEYSAWSSRIEIRDRLERLFASDSESESGRRKLIVSHHDFDRTPAELATLFKTLSAARAQIVKVATHAERITDSLRMLSALREQSGDKATIALCMGEAGLMTRVLARKCGAFLTFASVETGRESAPGQLTVADLRRQYRWDTIDTNTAVFGVVGCPIAHSMSPALHNAAFGEVGFDGVYLPFRVEPGDDAFAGFVQGCLDRPWLTLRGLSVTIPHKVSALRFAASSVEPLARKIGAVNTLAFDESGRTYGSNTDYAAILDSLTAALSCDRTDLRGEPVAVLGAGGAARAAVAGLADCGAVVTVYNRTLERAGLLAADFDCAVGDWADRARHAARIVINTTSVGMHPNGNESPLLTEALHDKLTVFDTVYNPVRTRLLDDAERAGCRTIDGVTMFVRQAAAQFERFTGRRPPVERMRDVVLKRLQA